MLSAFIKEPLSKSIAKTSRKSHWAHPKSGQYYVMGTGSSPVVPTVLHSIQCFSVWQAGLWNKILCKVICASKDAYSTKELENRENLTASPDLTGFPPFAATPSSRSPPHTVPRSRAGRSGIHTLSLSAACLSQKHLCRCSRRCPGLSCPKSSNVVSCRSGWSRTSQNLLINSSNQRQNVNTLAFLLKISRPCPKSESWPLYILWWSKMAIYWYLRNSTDLCHLI